MTICIPAPTLDRDGYPGPTSVDGVAYRHHKAAYVRKYGPVAEGIELHHVCGHRWCMEADHLDPMPRDEHRARHKAERETCRRGHPRTEENVNRFIQNGLEKIQCKPCQRMNEARYRAKVVK